MNDHAGWGQDGRCVLCGNNDPGSPCTGLDEDYDKGWQLLQFCRKFINDHEINCPEVVYQSDRVVINAQEFIEKVCDIVGYHVHDEES